MTDAIPRSAALREQLGDIDIYLFDQLLRGRLDHAARVLDAGCGAGRNLVFLLRSGAEVFAADRVEAALEAVRGLAARLAPRLPGGNFQVAGIEALPWHDGSMDVVIASAVLHFAEDEEHFARMLRELWRVLAPAGMLFARLASSIGLHPLPVLDTRRRARLPDGSERFLVDEAFLLEWTARLGGELLDPLKTTNVQNLRCMTTWVLRKPA
jgi:tellurite methyltransferase